MCFILCCCCNLCNNYSSKCIEISILILSIASLTSSLIGLLFVNKEHVSNIGYICLLIVISFSIILIISIVLILIWRFKETINNKRNSAGSAFSKLGLVTTIFCLLFVGIWESMSISQFYDLNNPCQAIERSDINDYNKTNLILLLLRRNRRNLLTYEENKEEFCLDNPDYKIEVVSTKEYIYLFVSASTIEVILLVLLYLWYNDFRRIKYLVDGKLIDSNTKENKIKYANKKINFNNNYHVKSAQKDYVGHYDIYGRPIFNNNTKQSTTINKKNYELKKYNNKLDYQKKRSSIIIEKDKSKNVEKSDVEKIVYFDNNSSNERTNIYNLNFSKKINNNNNINLSLSRHSSKLNEIESLHQY